MSKSQPKAQTKSKSQSRTRAQTKEREQEEEQSQTPQAPQTPQTPLSPKLSPQQPPQTQPSQLDSDAEDLAFLEELHKPVKRPRKASTPDTAHLTAPKVTPGGAVVYISRLPHGFFETELRSYLSQFGDVTRLRLSRNPRTGASRHYAFVEFRHSEVANIVVETMHNYLLMGHLLQCKLVPEEKIHAELWKGANRKFVKIPWKKINTRKFNERSEKLTEEEIKEGAKKLLEKKKEQFKGIDYDFDSVLVGNL